MTRTACRLRRIKCIQVRGLGAIAIGTVTHAADTPVQRFGRTESFWGYVPPKLNRIAPKALGMGFSARIDRRRGRLLAPTMGSGS